MNKYLMKVNGYTIIIAVLLIFNLILRLSYLEYPLVHTSRWGDGTRDYLTGHYITEYGERPAIGPYNLLHGVGVRNSPLYYYLLASFLLVYDNILFLGIVNIFFQVVTILLVFFIAKLIFGNLVAIFSAALFSLIPEVLRQSHFIWQPNLMQPFAYLALVFLILAYLRKNYPLLLLSLATLSLAITIHNSAFAWFPLFILSAFWILHQQKKGFKYYLGIISVIFLPLILFYSPVIVFLVKNGLSVNVSSRIIVGSLTNYLQNFFYNFSQTMEVFSLRFGSLDSVIPVILIVFLGIVYFKTQKKRFRMLFFAGFFLFPIIFSSIFNKNQLHYLIISFGMFTIITSEITVNFLEVISKLSFLPRSLMTVIIILVLIKTLTSNFAFLNDNLIKQKNLYTEDKELILDATLSIQNHVFNIKQIQKSADFNFFQVVSFASNPNTFRYPPLDTIFLVPLEKNLNTKLAKISDEDIYTIIQTNVANYIFLSCFEFYQKLSVKDCTSDFLSLYPSYSIVENIYLRYPVSIFLAKKK